MDLSLHTDQTLIHYFCGQHECMPDVDKFVRAVTYKQGERDRTSAVVVWFWELVRTWDDATRRKLLKFWTSAHYVDIYSANPNQPPLKLGILATAPEQDANLLLPTAATCFREMMLPPCTTKEVLARQMLEAITHHNEAFGNI